MTVRTTLKLVTALAAALAAGVPARSEERAAAPPQAAQPDGSMRFELVTGEGPRGQRRWVEAVGVISPETPDRLQAFIDANDEPDLIVAFHSLGGDMAAARAIGRAIREAQWDTTVGVGFVLAGAGSGHVRFRSGRGRCRAACAIAFLGGRQRTLSRRAELAFHRLGRAVPDGGLRPSDPPTQEDFEQAQRDAFALARYAIEMGVDPMLLRTVVRAQPDGAALRPARETILDLGIASFAEDDAEGADGWWISARGALLLHRRLRRSDGPERPVDAELWLGCSGQNHFSGSLDILVSSTAADDAARLRTLRLTLDRAEVLLQPAADGRDWIALPEVGFVWTFRVPAESLEQAARRDLALELGSEGGGLRRVDLSDGLATGLSQLTAACEDDRARRQASGAR